jgi:hypothetical protein
LALWLRLLGRDLPGFRANPWRVFLGYGIVDYPAGCVWTRRIGGEHAIAWIPEAASVFCCLAAE